MRRVGSFSLVALQLVIIFVLHVAPFLVAFSLVERWWVKLIIAIPAVIMVALSFRWQTSVLAEGGHKRGLRRNGAVRRGWCLGDDKYFFFWIWLPWLRFGAGDKEFWGGDEFMEFGTPEDLSKNLRYLTTKDNYVVLAPGTLTYQLVDAVAFQRAAGDSLDNAIRDKVIPALGAAVEEYDLRDLMAGGLSVEFNAVVMHSLFEIMYPNDFKARMTAGEYPTIDGVACLSYASKGFINETMKKAFEEQGANEVQMSTFMSGFEKLAKFIEVSLGDKLSGEQMQDLIQRCLTMAASNVGFYNNEQLWDVQGGGAGTAGMLGLAQKFIGDAGGKKGKK